MVRKEVLDIANRFIKEDIVFLRKLAEEHKYLKR